LGKLRSLVVTVHESVDFRLSATDKSGDPLVFSGRGLIHGETLDPDTGDFRWIPSPADAGDHYFIFTVAQIGSEALSDSDLMRIRVRPDLQKPLVRILSPSPRVIVAGDSATVHGVATDNVGVAKVEFMLENANKKGEYQLATGQSNWTARVTGLVPGVNTVRVRAMDLSGNISRTVERRFVVQAE